MNTDIHRSRSGLGHRVGATERRPRCVRCSGPQQRPNCAAPGALVQILHAAPYATHPPPTSGGNAPTRSSPTPTPSPIEPNPRCRSPRSPRRNSQCRRCAPRPLRPRCSLSEWAVQTAPRGRRHRIDGAGGQPAGQLPGHRRPRTPSPARHEPADPGRRRQCDDQRGRAELRVRRRPPARRSGRRDQRDLEHPQRPRHTCPETRRPSVPRWRGPSASAHERSCGSGRTGAPAYSAAGRWCRAR